jgi:glycerophosphoryl diester phosphodiesterase
MYNFNPFKGYSTIKSIIMKKTFFLSFILMSLFAMASLAQSKNQQGMLLSNYTYTAERNLIGKVVPAADFVTFKQVKLMGPTAKFFTIDKDHQVFIKKEGLNSNAIGHDLTIEAKTADGKRFEHTFYVLKDQFKKNKVIAHRGSWKNTGATENSIAALKFAVEQGCEGSEFDVHMSADSVLFVHHDHEIDGVHIEKANSAVLSKMKLGNGEYLPTLEAYIKEGLKQQRTLLILEFKPSSISKERGIKTAEKCVELVRSLKAEAWVNYIGFDYAMCKRVIAMDPYAKVAYLNGDKTPSELAADKFFGFDYHLSAVKKNEHWIKEAHDKKLTVNVWTVNDPQDMDWLLSRNVDFITTNEPELLFNKIKE